jgi:hypothetical protein
MNGIYSSRMRVPHKLLIGLGSVLAVAGTGMNLWWDRLSDAPLSAPEPLFSILRRGFTPVFIAGLLLLSAGCVTLSRDQLPPRNYLAAALCTATVPMTALLLRLGILSFDFSGGFEDWPLMLLVLMFLIFMLGLMFLVAAVSYRRWE